MVSSDLVAVAALISSATALVGFGINWFQLSEEQQRLREVAVIPLRRSLSDREALLGAIKELEVSRLPCAGRAAEGVSSIYRTMGWTLKGEIVSSDLHEKLITQLLAQWVRRPRKKYDLDGALRRLSVSNEASRLVENVASALRVSSQLTEDAYWEGVPQISERYGDVATNGEFIAKERDAKLHQLRNLVRDENELALRSLLDQLNVVVKTGDWPVSKESFVHDLEALTPLWGLAYEPNTHSENTVIKGRSYKTKAQPNYVYKDVRKFLALSIDNAVLYLPLSTQEETTT